MPTEKKKVTRKLSAILSADVKGYSILMADDEVHTIETLKAYRHIVSDLVSNHSGRVVDSPGDNILAEFRSSVDAVECAVKIQKALDKENSKYVDDKKVQFRIGVNIGDVIQDGDRIYGNGVNVAARIEGLADPGGVCISRNVYNHVGNKLSLGYEYLGEHTVKNIKKPVRAYKLLMADEDAGKLIGDAPKRAAKNWIWATVILAAVILIAVSIQIYRDFTKPEFEPAKVEDMAYQLPEKPSIAVLSFDNMSGDPEQEYFSDGLSEEIITALSKTDQLFVIARNSTFTYKGKPVKIKQIAEELGVRYVLEGSVRKTQDRVRITAQLIDAISGHHLWADRYDRDIKDIFAVQDEITMKIVTALQIKLTEGEQARMWAGKTKNLDFRFKHMEALSLWRKGTVESLERYGEIGQEMIDMEPENSIGYRILAWYNWGLATRGKSPKESNSKAFKLAQKALSLDESDAYSHALLGSVYLLMKQHEKAISEGKRSIELYPNGAMLHGLLGNTLSYAGKPDEAIGYLNQGIRLNPFPAYWYFMNSGRCYLIKGQYEDALSAYKKALDRAPNALNILLSLAVTYALLDRQEEAEATAKKALEINPNYSVKYYLQWAPYKNETDLRLISNAMRKSGIPEYPSGKEPHEKPSIAVLPFDNLSDDPEQEYFSDGISEDIITDLSKISGLIVIARNSSFSYKGKSIKVQQIGQELNVRYLLEGSVRKAGNQVRINAQLIDANSGHHIWADRYDGDMSDIFSVQDKISRKIISALALKLTKSEQEILIDKGTNNIQAYVEFLKGWQGYRLLTKEGFAQAKIHLEKAVELDTEFARAYAAMAILYWKAIQLSAPELRDGLGLNDRAAKSKAQAKPQLLLKKAMKKPTALAHGLMSQFYLFRYQHDEALAEIEKAISMDPNDPELYAWLSHILWLLGRSDEAIASAKMGMRLDPINPETYLIQLGKAYIPDGDLNKSLHALERAKRLNPDLSGVTALSMSIIHGIQGKYDEARTVYEYFLKHRMYPVRDMNALLLYFPFADPKKLDPIAKALIMAGAPGKPTDYYKILKENRIAGQDIKALIFGHKVTGISIFSGNELQWEWSKSGDFQFTAGTFQDQGKSWVEGDVIFLQYKKFMGGLPYGSTIYRNPEGSSNSKNQYLLVSDVGSITPVALIE